MAHLVPPGYLLKIANGRNVMLLFVLFITFTGGIMPSFEADIKALSGGVGVIDLEFFYSPEKVHGMLSAYGSEGIRLYLIAQWTVDLVFPAIAGAFFSLSFIWLGSKYRWWIGMLVMFADWTENVFITILLAQFPRFSTNIAMVSCFFTSLKWASVFVANMLLLYYGAKKWSVWDNGKRTVSTNR